MIIRTKLTTQNQFLRRFSMNRLLNRYPEGQGKATTLYNLSENAKTLNLVYLTDCNGAIWGQPATVLFGKQEGDSQGSVSSLLKN